MEFACPGCGQNLEAPEEMAGQVVACPACEQEMTVPEAEPPDAAPGIEFPEVVSGDSFPDVMTADEESGGESCASCGETLEPGAVLCIACGFHAGLGRRIETKLD